MKLLGQMENVQELASVFNSAAIMAIRQGHFKQGLSLYKSALAYVTSDSKVMARVFFNMGVGLVKWGKSAQALSAFEQAVAHDAEFGKAVHNLGILKGQSPKGSTVVDVKRLVEVEALGEDEDIGSLDFGLNAPSAPDAEVPAGDDGDGKEIDDSYFQSLVSGS